MKRIWVYIPFVPLPKLALPVLLWMPLLPPLWNQHREMAGRMERRMDLGDQSAKRGWSIRTQMAVIPDAKLDCTQEKQKRHNANVFGSDKADDTIARAFARAMPIGKSVSS